MLAGNRRLTGGTENNFFVQHVAELLYARRVPHTAGEDFRVHIADPGKFGGFKLRLGSSKQWLEGDGRGEYAGLGSITRRGVIQEVGNLEPARARHVLRHHGRLARYMVAPMARQDTGIGIVTTADAETDIKRDCLSSVEIGDLIGADGTGKGQGCEKGGRARNFQTTNGVHVSISLVGLKCL